MPSPLFILRRTASALRVLCSLSGKLMNRTLLVYLTFAGALAAQPAYDLLLKGGHVVDPKSKISQVMDVAVAGGKVARLARGNPGSEAEKAVNGAGLYVTPGIS